MRKQVFDVKSSSRSHLPGKMLVMDSQVLEKLSALFSVGTSEFNALIERQEGRNSLDLTFQLMST